MFTLGQFLQQEKGQMTTELMSYIKWCVFLMTTMPCILMCEGFECHFKPVSLSKIELRHPVHAERHYTEYVVICMYSDISCVR